MSFDRRRCGRETRWREQKAGGSRKRKWKTGDRRKRKGFPLQVGVEGKGKGAIENRKYAHVGIFSVFDGVRKMS